MSPMNAEHLLFNSGWLSDDFPNEFTTPPPAPGFSHHREQAVWLPSGRRR